MAHRIPYVVRLVIGLVGTVASSAAWAMPGDVTGLAATATSPHSVRITWSPYVGADFGKYEVRRGNASGVTRAGTLVGTISDSATATIFDSSLVAYTTYYYRVFVVSPTDMASVGVEVSIRTQALTFPHSDLVDSVNLNFKPEGTWAIVRNGTGDGDAHTGTWHWSDSPGGNYAPNANVWLTLTINLGTAIMPVLTYWERYSFETNVDYGYVEVSQDGTNWTQAGFVTGSQTVWAKKQMDLTQWAGYGEVRIRFRVNSNSVTEAEGWHLDDLTVTELSPTTLPYPFVDVFDSTGNWITSAWSLASGGRTLPNAIHDSKQENYPRDTRNLLVSAGVFNLFGATNPVLTFWHKYNLFTDHSYPSHNEDDWAQVYVSASYGGPGSYVLLAQYTGAQSDWVRVQLDLRQFVGSSSVRVMFMVNDQPDYSYPGTNRQADGWYLDDVRVEELPQDVIVSPITNSSMHHATLAWTRNPDGDFSRYEIYRAASTTVNRSSTLVRTFTDQNVTTFTDSVAMIQPTQYSYRVYVIDTLETSSLGSNVVTATYTIPQKSFPFADSMNAGTTNWAWGTPWGPTTATYHSAPTSWTDSPDKSYTNGTNSALAAVVNLSGSSEPVLTFWQRYDLEENADYAYVEVSPDGGNTWTSVLTVTGTDTTWRRQRISLRGWIGQTIGLRFRLQANASISGDGWYVDDVEIANSTRLVTFPFADDVESDTTAFFFQSPWGYETVNSHSGSKHWSDSPAGNYANNTSSALTLAISLSGSSMPVLTYWERYSFQANADYGFIEVSTDGANWWQYGFVTGVQAEWRQRRVDLSDVAGNSTVRVRFRVQADASSTSDGWHIDDVAINETPTPTLPYPYATSVDSASMGSWIASGWGVVSGGSNSGVYHITDSPLGNYPGNSRNTAITAGVLDLSQAVHPVLIFWHRYNLFTDDSYPSHNEHDYAVVVVSDGYGHSGTWTQIATYGGALADWTRVQLDLSAFAGQSAVRIAFGIRDQVDLTYPTTNRQSDGWHVDDIRVEELPVDVAISPITNSSMHHATLAWARNPDGDFSRYEIYRATNTSITRSSELIKVITDQSVTAWTDTFAAVQPTKYSYRMWVIDKLETVSLGSNTVTASYTTPTNAFPFADDMSDTTKNWAWGHPWGPATNAYHSAPTSWKSGPGTSYPANANTALQTTVNLSGSTAPVLTFWHRYAFESATDFGRVEVSRDGGNTWTQLMSVTGIDTTWGSERIDLGAYVGSTISLRFRVTSNAEMHLDGWYIDDVEIKNGARSVAFPYFDDMESGERAWFRNSPWGLSNVGSHSGEWHWTDSPSGSYAPNENTSLTLTIDLSGSDAPVLRFWERYSFEPNADWGFIEVSTNAGGSWTQELFVTGSQASWRQESVDLSPYRGNPGVMIRFRLVSNGASQTDGWHLDDFAIEDVRRVLPYPFTDSFDDTALSRNWLTSSWEYMTGGRSSPYLFHDSPLGNYPAEAFSSLTLAGTIDLRGATNPVLTFWHKYAFFTDHGYPSHNEDDCARVYVSPDNGQVWYNLYAVTSSLSNWTKVSLSLTQFVGAAAVRVRFVVDDNVDLTYPTTNRQADGWWIDDVRIGEDLAVQALADSVRLEGPGVVQAAPGLASPRLIGRGYEPNVTNLAGQGVNVVGQFGVGSLGSMPNDTTWTWFAGGYLDDASNFDRFYGSVRVDSVGTYSLAFRASIDNGATWVYGDLDGNNLAGGGVSEFEVDKAGLLVVGLGGKVTLSDESLHRYVRVNQQEIWSLGIGNDGPDPLYWRLAEASAARLVTDIPWMVIQKTSGVLKKGEQVRVDITFDATGLKVDSTYSAKLLLTSNDAQNDSIWIDVALSVLSSDVSGFTGWVAFYGGGQVSGGRIIVYIVYDESDIPVDTLDVALNGWFAGYGISAGTYRIVVQVSGAYPQEFLRVGLPMENATIKVSPIHPLVQSPFFMDVYSDASTLDGLPLPVGSVVTVRDADGIVVGGYVVHTEGKYGFLHVYADDPNTPADEGAEIGDTLGFFVNDVRVNTTITYENHNALRPVDLAANSVTPRHLEAGLHLISVAVMPRDTAIQGILASIAGKHSYVAGFDQAWGGARTYVDSLQEYSDLHTLDGLHGYWLRMEEPGNLVVYGSKLHDDVPIPVKAGWNLISYLPVVAYNPDRALASVRQHVSVVGGFDAGAQTYVPGSPLNDLVAMKPGLGYWLYSTANAYLNYRAGASGSPPIARPAVPEVAQTYEVQPVPTRQWMDLYGGLTVNGRPAETGTIVSIADEEGVICGTTIVRTDGKYGFLHVYADDPLTSLDEGAVPGESLSLLIDGRRVYGAGAIVWRGDQAVVRADLDVSLTPTNVGLSRPLRFGMEPPHPNPFNPRTVIRYELALDGPVMMAVYDQLGQRVSTLVAGVVPAGRHVIAWDGTDRTGRALASGAYFVRLVSDEGTVTRRVVLLR